MKQYFLLLTFAVLSFELLAQEKDGYVPDLSISELSLVSSGKDLPFWMTSNQNGTIALHNPACQLFQAGIKRQLDDYSEQTVDLTYGGSMVYGLGGGSDLQLNQYWLGVRISSLVLKAGAQSDPVIYEGLSSTNGNMDQSGNARPVPGVGISTNGYVPFLFAKKWFSFRFTYQEGTLSVDKHQAVTNTHLHHKNIYLRNRLSRSLWLTLGLEHYVFWGGNSPVFGPQPRWKQYLRYILERKGGEGAVTYDQQNMAGNGLGMYNVELKKEWRTGTASIYWNHPFEDRSGVELTNIKDGLWGIYLGKKKKKGFVTDFVYEYMYTLNQSGSKFPRGNDNYFNHYLYSSGYTYFMNMMGTPLFVPRIGANGISQGFKSTKMWMHHLGISGKLDRNLSWKSFVTFSRNFGSSIENAYPKPLDQLSFLFEGNYSNEKRPYERQAKFPYTLKAGVSADIGNRFQNRFGAYLGISFQL